MRLTCEIWIVSHIPNKKGMEYLLWALESCHQCQDILKIQITIHLSVYWAYKHNDDDLTRIREAFPEICIYVSEKQLLQFQHLKNIYLNTKNKYNAGPNDIIFF